MTNEPGAIVLEDQQLDTVHAAGYLADAGYAVGSALESTYARVMETGDFAAEIVREGLDAHEDTVEDALQALVDGLRSGMNGNDGSE